VKYNHGIGETITAKKPQVETGKPKVLRIDVAAAQDTGSARAMDDGIVILKNALYHLRRSSASLVILMRSREIRYGKHNGATSQLMSP
jgi:hypothetical protein